MTTLARLRAIAAAVAAWCNPDRLACRFANETHEPLDEEGPAVTTTERLRDAGMQQAEEHADPRVILAIDAAIDRANASGQPWSANDIRAQFPSGSQGLVGSRVRAASQRRPAEMVCVGREPSTLASTHHHEIKVWVGAGRARAS